MLRRVRVLVPLLAALATSPGSLASADAPEQEAVTFRWEAPTGCPTARTVRARVDALLGGTPIEHRRGPLSVVARVRRAAPGRWSLQVSTMTPGATRVRDLVGPDCSVLAEAAALLAAMAIDPALFDVSQVAGEGAGTRRQEAVVPVPAPAVRTPARPEAPAPAGPEVPVRSPSEAAAPARPVPERGPPRRAASETRGGKAPRLRQRAGAVLGVSVGADYGALPGVAPVLRAWAGAAWPHARLVAAVQYGALRRTRLDGASGRGADLQQVFAAVRGCGVPTASGGRLEIPLCGAFEAGALVGRGVGFAVTRRGALPWLALSLRAGVVGRVHPRLGLGLWIEPWLSLVRATFHTDDATVLWRSRRAGVRGLGGLEVRF